MGFKKTTEKIIGKTSLKSKIHKFNPKILLSIDGDNINIKIKNNIKFKTYIEIKHRFSGRRITQEVKNRECNFSIEELIEMVDSNIFNLSKNKQNTLDFYFKQYKFGFYRKRRLKYDLEHQFKGISKEYILKSYSTKQGNLSMNMTKNDFDYNITNLSVFNKDKVLIKGNLEILNNEINKIDKIEIIGKNRIDSQSNVFNLKFNKKNEQYNFEGIIDDILPSNENTLSNLRIDFFIRFYEDEIYYQKLMDLSTYKSYIKDEDRFLIQIEKENNLYSYYVTEGKNSFALWITTKNAFNKTYTIAKGRTIYNNSCNTPMNKNMIFFESFFGKAYSGNPKYIYETLLEMGYGNKFTFVWSYIGDKKIPGNPIIVDRNEAGDYYKYLAESKYWVNNILFPIHKKRDGNVYLQTWHGTPLKKLGWDITIPGPEVEARENFHKESRNWDYLISSNPYSTEIFKRAFKFDKDMIELGYPINDIFFKDNKKLVDNIKNKFNIPKDKDIILYAPTWKDDEKNENWNHYFNLEIDLKRLYENFKDEYFIILKMHHLVSENIEIKDEMLDFAIDLSDYDDIQELYILSDLLITDYSSVFFDYAHSKRPILFFVPDLNHYIENVRGLYLNMEKDLPGPLIKNNDELINIIQNIDKIEEKYKEKYEEFYNRFCSLCKGQSSENIVKKIFK